MLFIRNCRTRKPSSPTWGVIAAAWALALCILIPAGVLGDRCPAALKGLAPESLWNQFGELTQIPRPSKKEAAVMNYIKDFAATQKLEWKEDQVGNLVVYRPGSGGGEKALPVMIQTHVDMVTEANQGVEHDFDKDPIRVQVEGDWVLANGTTLGADNGIGAAACLALLEEPSSTMMPPLECLFTVEEEIGLTGAYNLDSTLFTAKTMLNLDSEEWGSVTIGCAGGGKTEIELPVKREAVPSTHKALLIRVHGLIGGHSGLNIHEYRGNSLVIAAKLVRAMEAVEGSDLRLNDIQGGDKFNAIPRECTISVFISANSEKRVRQAIGDTYNALRAEYGAKELYFSVGVERVLESKLQGAEVLDASSQTNLLTLLLLMPNGPTKMSHVVDGLTETSNNLASITSLNKDTYKVVTSTRSSHGTALESVRDQVEMLGNICGATVKKDQAFAGWAPDTDSPVVQIVAAQMQQMTGSHSLKALHAGLECGIIGDKVAGLDMVSFGPTIVGAHSPDERVQVSTVSPFWALLKGTLKELATKNI